MPRVIGAIATGRLVRTTQPSVRTGAAATVTRVRRRPVPLSSTVAEAISPRSALRTAGSIMLRNVVAGRLKPRSLVTHEFTLDEFPKAYDTFANDVARPSIILSLYKHRSRDRVLAFPVRLSAWVHSSSNVVLLPRPARRGAARCRRIPNERFVRSPPFVRRCRNPDGEASLPVCHVARRGAFLVGSARIVMNTGDAGVL
jgi:hypothetical protein